MRRSDRASAFEREMARTASLVDRLGKDVLLEPRPIDPAALKEVKRALHLRFRHYRSCVNTPGILEWVPAERVLLRTFGPAIDFFNQNLSFTAGPHKFDRAVMI